MAVVTFGGAYAVLAYVAQEAVGTYGWLQPGEMLDGLGMAETTPGPLIMVLQFVGFLAAYREAGWAVAAAGRHARRPARHLGHLRALLPVHLPRRALHRGPARQPSRSRRALTAITAAVVGVILNLAIWFAIHTVFAATVRLQAGPLSLELPVPGTVQWIPAALAALALLAVFRWKLGLPTVLVGGALLGLLLWAVGGL